MPESDVAAVIQRADVISFGTLAEMNHFQRERVADYKEVMQKFLHGQIKFYREVSKRRSACMNLYTYLLLNIMTSLYLLAKDVSVVLMTNFMDRCYYVLSLLCRLNFYFPDYPKIRVSSSEI